MFVGWLDVFTGKNHKLAIIDSLKYCQQNKGLIIFGWCLMPSHLHLIARAEGKDTMSDILRDFKKFTARKIVGQIQEEPESQQSGKEITITYPNGIEIKARCI